MDWWERWFFVCRNWHVRILDLFVVFVDVMWCDCHCKLPICDTASVNWQGKTRTMASIIRSLLNGHHSIETETKCNTIAAILSYFMQMKTLRSKKIGIKHNSINYNLHKLSSASDRLRRWYRLNEEASKVACNTCWQHANNNNKIVSHHKRAVWYSLLMCNYNT